MIQDEREQIERIKYAAQRRIWVTFQKEGIHFYPAAATDPALKTGDEYDAGYVSPKEFGNQKHLMESKSFMDYSKPFEF